MDRRVSSLGLLAGVLTRFTAASFIVIILGAITTFHFSHGFFMNGFGQQQGEEFEYHLLVIGVSAVLGLPGKESSPRTGGSPSSSGIEWRLSGMDAGEGLSDYVERAQRSC